MKLKKIIGGLKSFVKKFSKKPKPEKKVEYHHTHLIVRLDVTQPKWSKVYSALQGCAKDVRQCRLEEGGLMHVSGQMNQELLVKKLDKHRKKLQMIRLEAGKCSTILFGPK